MSNASGSGQPWVLIVDDSDESRVSTKDKVLRHIPSANIVKTMNGDAAFSRIQSQRFDLVIIDFDTPRTDGTELVEKIARLPIDKMPGGVIVGFAPQIGVGTQKTFFQMRPFEEADLVNTAIDIVHKSPKATKQASAPAPGAPAAPAAKQNVDVTFIAPFVEGAVVVLETVCNTKSTKETVFIRQADSIRGDISAVVAMNSSKKQGSFAVTFEKNCFLKVAGEMLGENYTEINDDNRDVVGEICNQIFGFAKKKLNNDQGYDIQPAIPSVITGNDHQIKHLIKGVVIAAKFKTEHGWFIVEAAVQG